MEEQANKRERCTLSDERLIFKAGELVSELAKSGGRSWSLRVPVDFNNDPDMIFCELANRLLEKNKQLDELEPKWIDVRDRLPVVKPFQTECVLVFGEWNNESFAIFEGGKFYDRDQTDDDTGNSIEISRLVTHWMPLPSSPQEQTKEN